MKAALPIALVGLVFAGPGCGGSPSPVDTTSGMPITASPPSPPDDGKPRSSGTTMSPAPAADFYVATDGNDSWDGLAATHGSGTHGPLATFQGAQAKVRSLLAASPTRKTPIVVMFASGAYWQKSPILFTSADSGTADVQIVYESNPSNVHPVFISGGVQITGWTKSGSTYTASLSSSEVHPFEELFVNGVRRFRPVTSPGKYLYNAGPVTFSYDPKDSSCPEVSSGLWQCFDRFRYSGTDMSSSWTNPNAIEIDDFEQWTMSRMRLKSVDETAHIAYLTGPTYMSDQFHGFLTGHRYVAENVKESFNQAGEWYLNQASGGTGAALSVEYIPVSDDGDLTSAYVVAPQLPQILTATGLDHVTFRGFVFDYADYAVPAQGHPSGQGEQDVPAAVSFVDGADVTVDLCTFSHMGPWALEFVGTDGHFTGSVNERVTNSLFYDLGTGGVRVGVAPASGSSASTVAQSVLVQNNLIVSAGRFLPQGTPIWVGDSHDNVIANNEIHDSYNVGISVGYTFNSGGGLAYRNTIENNLVYDLGQGVTSDMGGIYLLVSNPPEEGNVVTGNIIHDVTNDPATGGYGGWGLYFDQGTSNVVASNNLVYRTAYASVHQNYGSENITLRNNILAYGAKGSIDRGQSTVDTLELTVENNLFYWDSKYGVEWGVWSCLATDGKALPCTDLFKFTGNQYYRTDDEQYVFSTTSPTKSYDLAGWQALGEDALALYRDPGFLDPSAGDFTLKSTTATPNFTPFLLTAGRTSGGVTAPATTAPEAFPLQLLSTF